MKKVKLAVIGAGSRGAGYAEFAEKYPDRLEIVAVAEPREYNRSQMVEKYHIPKENVFSDWKEFVEKEKIADGVIIATQDNMHTEPAIACARKGYHIMLEKPMAPTAEECKRIITAAKENKIIFAVCHVLRYTNYTKKLKEILDSGIIGDVITMQHIEEVGWWHQAHSFVRGNWSNEKESSFMLLAKSCHDIDWINYIMGHKCQSVSSFGSLKHFRSENKPAGAGNRCVNCVCEPSCPYSAVRIYLKNFFDKQLTGWPVDVLTPVVNRENIIAALEKGPYGRCVYECNNDVIDNQVVNMFLDGGQTVSFMLTAFAKGGRKTRIFGSKGEIFGDSSELKVFDFLTEETTVIKTNATDGTILGGHGGGDYGLMDNFVAALAMNDHSKILSGPDATLESHLLVFAAEKSRRENTVVNL
ncbi:MAG: Gfo/Idh/MocA family oxidoreductase [Victivallales bacterium]|nr:Gfo/Idh/MocA family oxidoreductase [Victivallales bacterium]